MHGIGTHDGDVVICERKGLIFYQQNACPFVAETKLQTIMAVKKGDVVIRKAPAGASKSKDWKIHREIISAVFQCVRIRTFLIHNTSEDKMVFIEEYITALKIVKQKWLKMYVLCIILVGKEKIVHDIIGLTKEIVDNLNKKGG